MQRLAKVVPSKNDKSILLSPQKPFFSLIWLHGLGDTSKGFQPFFQYSQSSPVFLGARVKLINAPLRPVTVNGGSICNSWYDIKVLSGGGQEKDRLSLEQVKETMAIIDAHVQDEIKHWTQNGIAQTEEQICKRIFIGGFSQGCAMSLCYGLTADRLLGGIIGFSGHLIESFPLKNKEKVPMLVYHGDKDNVLNFGWVQPQYTKHLAGLPNFSLRVLKGLTHSVRQQQLTEVSEWLRELLKQRQIKA